MNCYNCGDLLDESNRSEEHIINNSLGGRLKSEDLLCEKCNKDFGDDIDKVLVEQIGQFTDLLGIQRDRNNNRKIKIELVSETGESKFVGKKLKPLRKLIFRLPDKKITLFANEDDYEKLKNKKQEELEKKYKVSYVEYDEQPDKAIYRIRNKLSKDGDDGVWIGGKDFFRAIAKIALNYYLSKGFDKKYCSNIISFIKGEHKINETGYFFYPKHYNIHDLKQDEVSHLIYIKGDTQYKILYAYIELFNTFNVIIVFDRNYSGEAIESAYAYDLINAVELEKEVKVKLGKHHFEILRLMGL